jgi:predicted phage terminase large subunit-like protein
MAKRHLRWFGRQAWHIVEPATTFGSNWHFDAICDHLEAVSSGQIRRLLICIPPRHGKSTLVSILWPCWDWIQNPARRWLFASYSAELATCHSVSCRRVIESQWYQQRWGDGFTLTSDQNEKDRYEHDKSGCRLAIGVGGGATGQGGDLLVVDDPHNVRHAQSDTVRQVALDWWDHAMSTRNNDPRTGAKVIVMQRVHENDLAGHVLQQGGYETLILPTEYEGSRQMTSVGWCDPRTEIGELLWPERFGAEEVAQQKRELGSYAAAAQLQQRPAPAEGGILKRHWWKYYQEAPRAFDEVIQSWDCAFKDTHTSDYVVGQVWGRQGASKYLLDQERGRMDCPATIRAVRRMSEKWPQAKAKLVEDKANGSAVIAMLKHEIEGLIPVNPEGGKESRVHAVSPQIEAGNVYLPEGTRVPWIGAFIDECATFPQGAYDDQVDAMTQALLRLGKAARNSVFQIISIPKDDAPFSPWWMR